MDYRALFNAMLPDLLVVVALFGALGVDYARMRGRDLAARYRMAARISSWGLGCSWPENFRSWKPAR